MADFDPDQNFLAPVSDADAPATPMPPASGSGLVELVPPGGSDANPVSVNADLAPSFIAKGYHSVNPEFTEAAEHPVEAGALAFGRNLIPGGGALVSDLGGPNAKRQELLSEANPTATTIGGVAGGLTQAVAVGAATGGLGDLAEVGALGTRLAAGTAIGATQGLTGGMQEDDLGDVAYNGEALAAKAGIGGILGLTTEGGLAAAGAVLPKVVSFAKSQISNLEDIGAEFLGKGAALYHGQPELAEQIPEFFEGRASGDIAPLSKAQKAVQQGVVNDAAQDFAKSINQTADSVADLYDTAFGETRDAEITAHGAIHDAQGGAGAARAGLQQLIGRAGDEDAVGSGVLGALDEIKAKLAPALEAGEHLPKPFKVATSALDTLQNTLEEVDSSADQYRALVEARRLIQKGMKYGNKLSGIDQDAANMVQTKVLAPIQDMLGRIGEDGQLTPQSAATFGTGQALRNAELNQAFAEVSTAGKNLFKRMGVSEFAENGRPDREVGDAQALRLIKGEGEPGSAEAINLGVIPAKKALDAYIDAASKYADVVGKSAMNAEDGSEIDQVTAKVQNSINDLKSTRDVAHDAAAPNLEQNIRANTAQGSGLGSALGAASGFGGDLIEAGGLGAVSGVLGAGTGGALGAAGLALKVGQVGLNAVKDPIQTINSYLMIRKAAASIAGSISSSVRSLLATSAGRSGAVAAAVAAERNSMADRRSDFEKTSKSLGQLSDAGPGALLEQISKGTDRLVGVPNHTTAVGVTAMRAAQVLAAALPRDPSPSPLGPGHSNWKASDSQILAFENIQNAVYHPEMMIKNIMDGSASPSAIQAWKTVYPKLAADASTQALQYILDHNGQALNQRQRMGLQILLPFPAFHDLTPAGVASQQATFTNPPPPPAPGKKLRSKGADELHIAKDTAWSGSAPGRAEDE